jgi:hypothetical protein
VDCARNKEGGLCQEQRGWIVPGTKRMDCARNKKGELFLVHKAEMAIFLS